MILVDTNLLLYAYDVSSEHHEAARRWVERAFSGPDPAALAWVTLLAFLRISTNLRVYDAPLSIGEAVEIIGEWLSRPTVTIVEPGERHWTILSSLLTAGQARGPLVMDAYLAALAIEHGLTLCTNDRDFTRFPNLRWLNPLES